MNKRLPDPVMKALLLCGHADELSRQCAIAMRHQSTDLLLEVQDRKRIVIEELAALSADRAVSDSPELRRALERLRGTLDNEMLALTESAQDLQGRLLEVRAAQRRLSDVRHYETSADTHLAYAGHRISVCG